MPDRSIEFKGLPIHYTERGKGPAVVLLHGFLESRVMWKDIIKGLAATRRVIAIDLLGHGQTPCLSYVHTMDEMAEAVHAVLKALGLRKVHLVGHSMGGYVGLAFAEHYPDMLKSLTLFYSTSQADPPEKRKDRDRAIAVVKQNPLLFVNASFPALFAGGPEARKPAGYAANLKVARETKAQGIVAALEGMKRRPDREVLLHFGAAPVYMISGEEDPRVPLESVKREHQAPRVGEVVITPGGHMGHLEEPGRCLQALRRFTAQ